MRTFFIMWRRELKNCFLSPMAYVTMVAYLAIAGVTLLTDLVQSVGSLIPPQVIVYEAVTFWMTFLVAIVTMRLFAEEKRSGTIEVLLTAPVTDWAVVMGKYAGAVVFILIATAPLVGSLFLVAYLSPEMSIRDLDVGGIAGGALFVALLAGLLTAIGEFVSLLTRNQIVAAIWTLCIVWFVLLFGWMLQVLPLGLAGAGRVKAVGEWVALTTHLRDFARGSVGSGPIVLFVSSTVFMLFASVRALESRHWR